MEEETSEVMTDAEIDAIEARANAVVPGPWEAVDDDTGNGVRDINGMWVIEPGELTRDEVAFIAAARSDVPELVAEVRRLRAVLIDRQLEALEG